MLVFCHCIYNFKSLNCCSISVFFPYYFAMEKWIFFFLIFFKFILFVMDFLFTKSGSLGYKFGQWSVATAQVVAATPLPPLPISHPPVNVNSLITIVAAIKTTCFRFSFTFDFFWRNFFVFFFFVHRHLHLYFSQPVLLLLSYSMTHLIMHIHCQSVS